MSASMPRIVVRFKTPFGQPPQPVSREMVDALMRLTNTEEIEPMLNSAEDSGRCVAVELYRASDGRPLLINFTMEEGL